MTILPKQTLLLIAMTILVFVLLRVIPNNSYPEAASTQPTLTPTVMVSKPLQSHIIPQKSVVVQTFNNCGPATLSMAFSYNGLSISQDILGKDLRPWQNPAGIDDDKSVFLPEMAREAEKYHLVAFHRPDGSIPLLKSFIANNIPVIVRTWLHDNEDIGHYRVVRGYDDTTQEIIQDDSYLGGNLRYSYDDFLAIWKPFNYEYLVLVPSEKEALVKELLGPDVIEQTAYLHANQRAQQELQTNPSDVLAAFNLSTSYYHLGEYEKSLATYEHVAALLPNRTLWYQLEPIEAYLQLKQYDAVLSLTDSILSNNNLAYSELYLIRAKAYQTMNQKDQSIDQVNKAIKYNENLPAAKSALAAVSQNSPIQINF